jgi:Ca2+-binding RTX toxin-like protein
VGDAVQCTGPRATVHNTDAILFVQAGLAFNTIDISGGLPAPRIEFRTDLGALGYGIVSGTGVADQWTLGGTLRAIGLNIDPSHPEEIPIVWDGLGRNVVVMHPGGGDDTVEASRIQSRHDLTLMEGGAGDDTLLGSPFRDALAGGRGRDVLAGGAGNDQLDGRDRDHDQLDCGAGERDLAQMGRGDSVRGCEKIERPGKRPG